MSEVKVYGFWGSPFSCRVEIALKLKGIKYEYIEEDLPNKSPSLLNYNPIHKKIPVLVHDGKPLAESLVIVEWIDEMWEATTPLLPKHPYQRAQARFWARFIDEKCLPAVRKLVYGKVEDRESARDETTELMKHLEKEVNGKKFLGGESVGVADIAATFIAHWLIVIQEAARVEVLTREKFPKLCEWIDELTNCTVIKETLPPREKLLAYYQARVPK